MSLNAILPVVENILPKAAEPIKALAAVTGNILPKAAQQTAKFAGTAGRNGSIERLSSIGLA